MYATNAVHLRNGKREFFGFVFGKRDVRAVIEAMSDGWGICFQEKARRVSCILLPLFLCRCILVLVARFFPFFLSLSFCCRSFDRCRAQGMIKIKAKRKKKRDKGRKRKTTHYLFRQFFVIHAYEYNYCFLVHETFYCPLLGYQDEEST